MHRIDGPGATNDNKFSEGDPANGTRATVVNAEWLNSIQEEIAQLIEDKGVVLSKGNSTQLQEALRRDYAQQVDDFASLRNLENGGDGRYVFVRYHSSPLDGGGGIFKADPSDTTSIDDDGFTIVTAGGLRWKRQSSDVRAVYFNIHANAGVDQTSKFQLMVDAAIALGAKYIDLTESGLYQASAVSGSEQVIFRGNGAIFKDFSYPVQSDSFSTTHRYAFPAGFEWAPFSHYSVDSVGNASVDFDVTEHFLSQEALSIVELYVDYQNGSDSSSGSSFASAIKTLNHAITGLGNVGTIWLSDGIHYLNSTEVVDATFGKPALQLKSFSGRDVTIRIGPDPADMTYTVSSGTSQTYEAPVSSAFSVYDTSLVDNDGKYTPLVPRTSKTEVNNNPGSFYFDSGSGILYVRRFTNTAPGTDLFVVGSGSIQLKDNMALYLENVKIEGGNTVQAWAQNGFRPRFYMKGGALSYGINFGLDCDGAISFVEETRACMNASDNFNYHVSSGLECNAVEINVESFGAGSLLREGPENKNGSSMHDGGSVIRINGRYWGNYGPNVIDTTNGSAINVGTEAAASIAPTSTQNRNFGIGASGFVGTGYCHFTRSKGSTNDYSAEGGGSIMNVADSQDSGIFLTTAAADSVQQYWPATVSL